MKYSAIMFPSQPKTKVFKFGYTLDAGGAIAWKQNGVKDISGFRDQITNKMTDSSVNKFNSLCLWIEISNDRGIGPMFNQIGNTFFEVMLSAQEDSRVTNKPPTAKFKSALLNYAVPVPPPPEMSNVGPCQLLNFTFDSTDLDNF